MKVVVLRREQEAARGGGCCGVTSGSGVSGDGGSDGGIDGVGGSGGSGVRWRVGESGVDDWIDRSEGNKFGFAGKSPLEKFSGSGSAVVAVAAGGGGVGESRVGYGGGGVVGDSGGDVVLVVGAEKGSGGWACSSGCGGFMVVLAFGVWVRRKKSAEKVFRRRQRGGGGGGRLAGVAGGGGVGESVSESTMLEGLTAKGIASIATLSSFDMMFTNCFSSAVSVSSSIFCFLELSYFSSSPALFELSS
nr:hypothetical protein [Tanacetum cinerariifolium]